MPNKSAAWTLLFVDAATVVGALFLLEAGLRLAAHEGWWSPEQPEQSTPPAWVQMLEPDPDDGVAFHLKPGLSLDFAGRRVSTNSMGFRGPELRAGTRRIVGIGDSVMFGWGVDEADTYLRVLEGILAERDAGIEVVNLATPAYNTSQEVALLERHLEVLRPVWVILGYLGDDTDPKRPLFRRESVLGHHSLVARVIARGRPGTEIQADLDAGKTEAIEALRSLGRLSRDHGFGVVAFLYTGLVTARSDPDALPHPEIRRVCQEEGFAIADLHTMLLHAIARGEIESSMDMWRRREKPFDPHPTPHGHRIIARALAQALESSTAVR